MTGRHGMPVRVRRVLTWGNCATRETADGRRGSVICRFSQPSRGNAGCHQQALAMFLRLRSLSRSPRLRLRSPAVTGRYG
jgi:hypothetical protein